MKPPPIVKNVLSLIGNTPVVELREFDTGPCRLFIKARKSEPWWIDQRSDGRVDDRGGRGIR